MSSSVELYSFEGCPYAQRTRMALIEKGVAFELIEVDLFDRPSWFRDISPYGKVPALRHAGAVIYESGIINQYLDEVFPQPALMPATPALRAQARIWMDYCETRFLPAAHKLLTEAADPAKRAENNAKLAEILLFIEQEGLRKLSEGPYFFGASPSLVDVHYSPFFERFGTYERLAGAHIPDECVRLRQWLSTMQTRSSYVETAHDVDYHLKMRARLHDRLAARRAPAAAAATG